MQKKLLIVLSCICSIWFVFSCSKHEKSSKGSSSGLGPEYNGSYISECDQSSRKSASTLIRLNILDSKATYTKTTYQGKECSGQILETVKGAMDLSTTAKYQEDPIVVKEFTKVKMSFSFDTSSLSALNTARFLGYSDWSTDTEKEVPTTAYTTWLKLNTGYTDQSTFKRIDNKLYINSYEPDKKDQNPPANGQGAKIFTLITSREGDYTSECILDSNGLTSSIVKLTISESGSSFIMTTYATRDCSGNVASTTKGSFNTIFGGRYQGADIVRLILISAKVTVNADFVTIFNSSSYLGYSDWAPGVEKDVTDKLKEEQNKNSNSSEYITILEANNKITINYYYFDRTNVIGEGWIFIFEERIPQPIPLQDGLDGTYSMCIGMEGMSQLTRMTISGSTHSTVNTQYYGANCSGDLSLKMSDVQILTAVGEYQGATIYKKDLKKATVAAYGMMAQMFKQTSMFGHSDWAPGVEIDVTNTYNSSIQQNPLVQTNKTDHALLKLVGNKLYVNPYWPEKGNSNAPVNGEGSSILTRE